MSKLLYVLKDGRKLSFQRNALFLDKEKIVEFEMGFLYKGLVGIRLLNRLLRLDPRCAAFINDDLCVVSHLKQLYFISIGRKQIMHKQPVRETFSNILNFCALKSYGYEEVYWGDYGANPTHSEVNIYRCTTDCNPKICYTFKAGQIKHIHNIVFDSSRNQFYVFTGDFEEQSGIYVASHDFLRVEPLKIGKQQYRAVVGVVAHRKLVYATDAVMEENFLYSLDLETGSIEKLQPLNGSVIYGIPVNGGLLLSTAVEPYPSSTSIVCSLLDNRLGKGIKSRNVEVLFVYPGLQVRKVASFRKDWLPMRLFQYGFVSFPTYENLQTTIVECNPVAVKKWDGKTYVINLDKIITNEDTVSER